MTTEQKANAYDEAIKKINSKWHYKNKPCFIDVAEIFPELAESEDERIKKWLIEKVRGGNYPCPNWEDKVIAWLEKQGKAYTKKDVDDAWLKGICDAKRELEKQGERPRHVGQKPVGVRV